MMLFLALFFAAESPHPTTTIPEQKPIVVDVVAYAPSGRSFAAAGAEVRVEVQVASMDEGESSLERAWIATADDKGRATFDGIPEPAMGRSLRAVARWNGHDWPGELEGRVGRVIVHELTSDPTSLRAAVAYTLMPREEELAVSQQMRLSVGDATVAYDARTGPGIRLPMLVHAVFGEPLDGAWLPPRPNPEITTFAVEPAWLGKLSVEGGTMIYRGLVPPGGVTLNAEYPVGYVEDTEHVLAMRSPVALEALTISLLLGSDLSPELALRTPFQTVVRPQGDGERRLLMPTTLPQKGEAFFVELRDTPSRLALLRPVAAGLACLVVIALVLAFFRTIGRTPGRADP